MKNEEVKEYMRKGVEIREDRGKEEKVYYGVNKKERRRCSNRR